MCSLGLLSFALPWCLPLRLAASEELSPVYRDFPRAMVKSGHIDAEALCCHTNPTHNNNPTAPPPQTP
eukprot:4606276-Amphidinium_carterae.1